MQLGGVLLQKGDKIIVQSCDAERMRIVQSGSDREDLLGAAANTAAGMLL